ncbi:MAG TPA: MFS transporter [Steroidobacteraceae bacterium]|jgi:FSR family fosmidomycin resistance protein-like MFS transporter|nr:MFS transporter [Steroidobacteraceae bacterium]
MSRASAAGRTAFSVLAAISFCHLLNDMMQSLLPALYPMLKTSYALTFGQIGILTFTYQITASLLQPLIGRYTDSKPRPYSLSTGMTFTLAGLALLASARSYSLLLLAAALIGTGSSVFHPESSRVARMASGGRHGLAQSVFQVGGNLGSAIGPLLAAFIVLPHGQMSVLWFSCAALLGIFVLLHVGHWYKLHGIALLKPRAKGAAHAAPTHRQVVLAISVLLALIFSKYFYLASLTSYYTFYLISRFHVTVQASQVLLFVFLGSVAVGTILGGPIGDRIGRKYVIWGSIVGVLPFTLLLPHANLLWTVVLTIPIGIILASAFPAIIVYAQELLPGRTGTVAGLFFGFAFGMGGIGAAVLGKVADSFGINLVYEICAFLPIIGLLAGFLPDVDSSGRVRA